MSGELPGDLPADDPEALLDALSELDDREARRRVLDRLAAMEPPPVDGILRRLEDERWFVRRNMLTLLREMPETPPDFSALPFLEDPDERVREEAFRVAIADPAERDRAVEAALGSEDRGLLRLALAAAEAFCPPAVEPAVADHAGDPSLPTPLRVAAVRALEMLRLKLEAPAEVRSLLKRDPPDLEAVEEILGYPWVEKPVYEALLDAVSELEERSHRRTVYDWLYEQDLPLEELVVDRLDDERWFVRRNMLALLQEMDEVPAGFSALRHCEDDDPRVRFEALKLALDDPRDREDALRIGLQDETDRVQHMALAGAAEGAWPADQEERLMKLARDEERPGHLRRAAVRALARGGPDPVRRELVDMVWEKKLFGHRLARRSEVTVAVLEGLAERWPDHPDVRPVLEAAREADDADLREAVT